MLERNLYTYMQKILLLLLILILGIFLYLNQPSFTGSKFKTIRINSIQIIAEIADTDEKRTKGLSNRDKLAQNEGMLFIFPKPSFYKFWMKDMKFPLDFIWIDKDTVVDVSENVPAPKSITEKLMTFTSRVPFDRVLEVNAGIAKSFNIVIGGVIH